MSEIRGKQDCGAKSPKGAKAFAVRSRVIRSKKLCCRKSKPRDQKVLSPLKVARLLRHAERGQKKSGSRSSLDTPHVSQSSDATQFSFSGAGSSVSKMPSHVSTPRLDSKVSTWTLSFAGSGLPESKTPVKSEIRSPKKSRTQEAEKKSLSSRQAEISSPKKLEKTKASTQGGSSADALLPLMTQLKVSSKKGSQKKATDKIPASSDHAVVVSDVKQDLSPEEHAHFMELLAMHVHDETPKESMSPEEHAHFMELLAMHVPDQASIPEEVLINAIDSPNGLSPEEYAHFLEVFQENDQSHQSFDGAVRFKPHARFVLREYLKKHNADIVRLQHELPGSHAGKWYEERTARADVSRIEVASLLDMIKEMENAGTDASMASRLFKIRAMKPLQNKVPQKWVIYENFRLQRMLDYIRRVMGLAKIETVADAVRTWRAVRANPEDRLMMYYMAGLIEHAIIRQNNDATARALARGEILRKQ
jgi:hypothetical protein